MTAIAGWLVGLGAVGPLVAVVVVLAFLMLRHDRGCVRWRAQTEAKLDALAEGQTDIKASVRSIEEHLRQK